MQEHPPDGPLGFTATDGRFVPTPPLRDLPDGAFDADQFRKAALQAGQQAATHAFARQFALIDGALGAATSGLKWAAGLAGDLGDPKNQHATEEILFEARRKRAESVSARVDALFAALERPETSFEFARRLSDVVGYPATQFANGYQTYMQAENRWAIGLIDALPPARLAPALSGLVRPWLFDPHRVWFFEPALQRFLESPHGDLRHLDGDVPVGELARLDFGFDPTAIMTGQMSPAAMIKTAKGLQAGARARQKQDTTRGADVSDYLGVPVTNADVDRMGVVGVDLLRRAHERKGFGWQPAGVFLAEGLRSGLTPKADALQVQVWAAYIAEHGHLIDRALGLTKDPSTRKGDNPRHAMALLRKLPCLPQRAKDAVFRTALGKKKSGRADAQRLLRATPGLLGRLAKEGEKRALDTRLQAAACLGFSGMDGAIPVLEAMLRSETTRTGQNACLAALARLAADLSTFSPGPDALIAEAQAVFDAPYPKGQRWLADLDLPDLVFADGTPAPVTLAPWLMRLAAQLGLPEGGPLLDLRLANLDPDCRTTLAETALQAFVSHDTLRWEDMTAPAHRPRLLEHMYTDYTEFFDWETTYTRENYPDQVKPNRKKLDWPTFRDQVTEARIAKFLKDKRNWEPYVHSANDAKGILGLARGLKAKDIKPILQTYLKDHARRTAQTKAVMTLYASFGGKRVIADLTQIADTQKQKGLRAHAADLLEDLGVTYRPPPQSNDETATGSQNDKK